MRELTTSAETEELEAVTVMGRTVYVSQRTQDAYVEFQDELVSMTNLRAWNHLMEKGKQEAIDGYKQEQTLAEKELERTTDRLSSDIEGMAHELFEIADKLKRTDDSG